MMFFDNILYWTLVATLVWCDQRTRRRVKVDDSEVAKTRQLHPISDCNSGNDGMHVDGDKDGARIVEMHNVRKVYNEKKWICCVPMKQKGDVAVSNLSLSMYENQVLALLGHNGNHY